MITAILENIATTINANLGGTFKTVYPVTRLSRKITDSKTVVFPMGFCEGKQEGTPLLNDYQANYLYFRQIAPMQSGEANRVSSRQKTVDDRYSIRMVAHLQSGQGGYTSENYASVVRQLLGVYTASFTGNINRVNLELQKTITEPLQIISEEVKGAYSMPRDSDIVFAIDFTLTIRYTPSSTCVIGGDDVCSLQTVTSTALCLPVTVTDTDLTETEVVSGGSFTCTNPNTPDTDLVSWQDFNNTQENSNYVVFNQNVLEALNVSAGLDKTARSVETFSDGGYMEGTMEFVDNTGTMIGISTGAIGPNDISRIDHGFYFRSQTNVRAEIYENGSGKGVIASGLFAFPPQTKFRVGFDGTNINYTFDVDGLAGGPYVAQSLTTYPSGTVFYADANMYAYGNKLLRIKIFQ